MSDSDELLKNRAVGRLGLILKGKYKLEKLLGVGGMSAVYQAVHRNGNRVAIKMLHPHVSLDVDARRRFLQEGYAANNVGHPGVVLVLDDDVDDDGSTFVVMELLEGQTLGEQARRNDGVLPDSFVMGVLFQLLDVLAATHEKGIIHRDIKPDNIFVTLDGTVKLLDFGIARFLDGAGPSTATTSGNVMGTPAYMPPEQALGRRKDVDHRTDLWAVGATLFHLLSGQFVHEAETTNELLVYIASRPARSLASVMPSLPTAVVALVDRALQFERKDRWPSARAMQNAVEAIFTDVYHTAPPARSALVTSNAARGAMGSRPWFAAQTAFGELPRRRRSLLWVAIPVVAMLGGGIAIAYHFLSEPATGDVGAAIAVQSAPDRAPEPSSHAVDVVPAASAIGQAPMATTDSVPSASPSLPGTHTKTPVRPTATGKTPRPGHSPFDYQ